LGGVKIGSRAVVGAESVVNIDVETGDVVVRVLVRVVRKRGRM
jgi:serine acetyltransferase